MHKTALTIDELLPCLPARVRISDVVAALPDREGIIFLRDILALPNPVLGQGPSLKEHLLFAWVRCADFSLSVPTHASTSREREGGRRGEG